MDPLTTAGIIATAANVVGNLFGSSASNNQSNRAASAQYKRAKELDEFDWESSLRKYEYAKAAVDLQRQTSENVRAYKMGVAEQSWQYQMSMREYEYKNAVDIFNRSERQFTDQLDMNAISSIIAQEEATRSFNEAQISNNFQSEAMARDLSKALDTSAFVKADLKRQRNYAIDSAFNAQENSVKALLGEGKARSRGAGRSAAKNVQSVLAASGRQQAQIVQSIANAENQFRIQATSIDSNMLNTINQTDLAQAKEDNNIDYKRQEYNQGLRELQASMDSAKQAFSANMMKIDRDRNLADMQAHHNRMLEPSMGPEIPRPLELPRSVFLDPLKPVRGPKPEKRAPQTISSWTTFANTAAGVGDAVSTIQTLGKAAGWF